MQFKYLESTRIKSMESLVGLRCAREQPRILRGNTLRLIAAGWSFHAIQIFRKHANQMHGISDKGRNIGFVRPDCIGEQVRSLG